MNRQALIIGIGYAGSTSPLPGSVNSANAFTRAIRAHGFIIIKELLDANATKANIAAWLAKLFAACPNAGDVAALYFAGHGVRVSVGGAATEALVPWGGLTDPAQLITASQLHQMFARAPAHAHKFTLPDCCYSAGIAPDTPAVTSFGAIAHAPAPASMAAHAGGSNTLSWAPCGPAQLSVERVIAGQWQCLFTSCALRAMADARAVSYAQKFAAARALAVAAYPQATPEMVGDPALQAKAFLS